MGQWIHNYPECVRVVVTVAEKGLHFQHNNQTDVNSGTIVGKRIKSCSEYFFYAFVAYFAQFPRGSGPDSTSALRNEVRVIFFLSCSISHSFISLEHFNRRKSRKTNQRFCFMLFLKFSYFFDL